MELQNLILSSLPNWQTKISNNNYGKADSKVFITHKKYLYHTF